MMSLHADRERVPLSTEAQNDERVARGGLTGGGEGRTRRRRACASMGKAEDWELSVVQHAERCLGQVVHEAQVRGGSGGDGAGAAVAATEGFRDFIDLLKRWDAAGGEREGECISVAIKVVRDAITVAHARGDDVAVACLFAVLRGVFDEVRAHPRLDTMYDRLRYRMFRMVEAGAWREHPDLRRTALAMLYEFKCREEEDGRRASTAALRKWPQPRLYMSRAWSDLQRVDAKHLYLLLSDTMGALRIAEAAERRTKAGQGGPLTGIARGAEDDEALGVARAMAASLEEETTRLRAREKELEARLANAEKVNDATVKSQGERGIADSQAPGVGLSPTLPPPSSGHSAAALRERYARAAEVAKAWQARAGELETAMARDLEALRAELETERARAGKALADLETATSALTAASISSAQAAAVPSVCDRATCMESSRAQEEAALRGRLTKMLATLAASRDDFPSYNDSDSDSESEASGTAEDKYFHDGPELEKVLAELEDEVAGIVRSHSLALVDAATQAPTGHFKQNAATEIQPTQWLRDACTETEFETPTAASVAASALDARGQVTIMTANLVERLGRLRSTCSPSPDSSAEVDIESEGEHDTTDETAGASGAEDYPVADSEEYLTVAVLEERAASAQEEMAREREDVETLRDALFLATATSSAVKQRQAVLLDRFSAASLAANRASTAALALALCVQNQAASAEGRRLVSSTVASGLCNSLGAIIRRARLREQQQHSSPAEQEANEKVASDDEGLREGNDGVFTPKAGDGNAESWEGDVAALRERASLFEAELREAREDSDELRMLLFAAKQESTGAASEPTRAMRAENIALRSERNRLAAELAGARADLDAMHKSMSAAKVEASSLTEALATARTGATAEAEELRTLNRHLERQSRQVWASLAALGDRKGRSYRTEIHDDDDAASHESGFEDREAGERDPCPPNNFCDDPPAPDPASTLAELAVATEALAAAEQECDRLDSMLVKERSAFARVAEELRIARLDEERAKSAHAAALAVNGAAETCRQDSLEALARERTAHAAARDDANARAEECVALRASAAELRAALDLAEQETVASLDRLRSLEASVLALQGDLLLTQEEVAHSHHRLVDVEAEASRARETSSSELLVAEERLVRSHADASTLRAALQAASVKAKSEAERAAALEADLSEALARAQTMSLHASEREEAAAAATARADEAEGRLAEESHKLESVTESSAKEISAVRVEAHALRLAVTSLEHEKLISLEEREALAARLERVTKNAEAEIAGAVADATAAENALANAAMQTASLERALEEGRKESTALRRTVDELSGAHAKALAEAQAASGAAQLRLSQEVDELKGQAAENIAARREVEDRLRRAEATAAALRAEAETSLCLQRDLEEECVRLRDQHASAVREAKEVATARDAEEDKLRTEIDRLRASARRVAYGDATFGGGASQHPHTRPPPAKPQIRGMTPSAVAAWVDSLGIPGDTFAANEIAGDDLVDLTDEELATDLGLSLLSVRVLRRALEIP